MVDFFANIIIKLNIFLLLNSFVIHAACRPVNLYLEPKWGKAYLAKKSSKLWRGSKRQMPIYDQGNTGLCYAYTAAQLVDFWRLTKGTRVTKEINLSTPLYAALLNRKLETSVMFGNSNLEGGYVSDALYAIKKFGMCSPDTIEASLSEFALKKKLDPEQFYEIVQFFYSEYSQGIKKIDNSTFSEIKRRFLKSIQKIKGFFQRGNNPYQETDLPKIFQSVAPYIQDQSITELMTKLFADCQKPENIIISTKYIPFPTVVEATLLNQPFLKDYIKNKLDLPNAQPVGITYCANVFFYPNLNGVYPDPLNGNFISKNDTECGRHASIIIGKKEIGGVCHFLIRNTWGTHCDYRWPCTINAQGEATGIWLSENALINNLDTLTTLSDPDLKCTVNVGRTSEVIEARSPNPIFPNQFFDLQRKPYKLRIQYDPKIGRAVFLFGAHRLRLFPLDPATNEGKNGMIYSRTRNFRLLFNVSVVCEKYSQKMVPLRDFTP
jgi:hypothetical protein